MTNSLRVRLAVWGLVLFGSVQIAMSGGVYIAISAWLENEVASNLMLTAAQVSAILYDPEEPPYYLDIQDVRLQLTNSNIATQTFLRDQMFFIRLLDTTNRRLVDASADYAIPLPPALVQHAYFDTVWLRDTGQHHELRVYTLPLSYTPGFALQVGVSLQATRGIQADMLRILVILVGVTVVLAPLGGWFLANRALIPIRATAKTAAEISETDLTRRMDLKSAELELQQLVQTFNAMLDRLEQAFLRQRQFTADAAHELRSPLSIIQTGLEVTLSQDRTAPEYRTVLVSLSEEVQRLSQLATTLLMLARAEMPTMASPWAALNLSDLLTVVVDQFMLLAAEKQLTITTDIPASLIMDGDETGLIQVMVNLLDNAVKYTPAGGQIAVMAQQTSSHIEFSVKDDGLGIPIEEQVPIFERFYRLDPARNRHQGGFGLGLAIAKKIVESHHGTIHVVSEPGQGALFVVQLPQQSSAHA